MLTTCKQNWRAEFFSNLPILQVAGKYLTNFENGEYEQALGSLDFKVLSRIFEQPGVSRNHSDVKCLGWQRELFFKPVVALLRQDLEKGSLQHLPMVGQGMIEATQVWGKPLPTRCEQIASLLDEVQNLFRAASPSTDQEPPLPSATRAALEAIMGLPAKDQLFLAFKHGKVGVEMMRLCDDVVSQSAKDRAAKSQAESTCARLKAATQKPSYDTDLNELQPT